MQPASDRRRRRDTGLTPRGRVVLGGAGLVVLAAAVSVPASVAAGLLSGGDDSTLRTAPAASPAPSSTAPSPSGASASASAAPTVSTLPSSDPSGSASASPSSAAAASASPSPSVVVGSAPAPDSAVVAEGTGDLEVVPGADEPRGEGPVLRYLVEVEGGLGVDAQQFAGTVHDVLTDPRGWGAEGERSFERVDAEPVDFRVALASPPTTDRLCLPLDTAGIFSCEMDERAVLNSARWLQGAAAYGDDVVSYREYLVSHEVGHALGFGHVYSCRPDGRAQVMQQQTKSLAGCSQNPWPHPDALGATLPTR